jgi:hypothetical protein
MENIRSLSPDSVETCLEMGILPCLAVKIDQREISIAACMKPKADPAGKVSDKVNFEMHTSLLEKSSGLWAPLPR